MKSSVIKTVYILLTASMLSSCGIHFRNKSDYPAAMGNTQVINATNYSQLADAVNLQIKGLGMAASGQPTSTITIASYSFTQSAPTISDSNTPITTTSAGHLCANIQKTNSKKPPLNVCVSQSEDHIVNTAAVFNPSNQTIYKQQLNDSLVVTFMQRLQEKDVWQYFGQ
jgi:outer membrane lipopolysaccharide assembly protein LptE/RlpB